MHTSIRHHTSADLREMREVSQGPQREIKIRIRKEPHILNSRGGHKTLERLCIDQNFCKDK